MPYLVTRECVAQKMEEWGPGSAAFQSRILGEFPSEGSDALVQLDWLEDAIAAKEIDSEDDDRLFIGLDIAYTGSDETVMVARRGKNIISCHRWLKEDTRGEVLHLLNTKYRDVVAVRVDSIGVGSFYEKWLADQGVPTIAANVAQKPSRHLKTQYKNLRAEAWWSIRTQLKDREIGGLCNLDQKDADELSSQLSTPKYRYDGSGKLVIESKEDMKRRGVSSPDLADALVLAFAEIDRWSPPGDHKLENTIRF